MAEDKEEQDELHFREDRDAPGIQKKSFVKEFYERHRISVDYVVLALISISTLTTVSLSIYIIIAKYF